MTGPRTWIGPLMGSVARQVMALVLLIVTLLVVGGVALAAVQAQSTQRAQAVARTRVVAEAVADAPDVLDALSATDPSAQLQPFAEHVRRDTATDFVVIMSPDRVRYTHPDPAQIGGRFIGGLGEALQGRPYTEQYTGTLGPSVRSIVPVTDDEGRVRALVAVGVRVARINDALVAQIGRIALAGAVLLAVGGLGAWLIGRRLRRQTHGLGEVEITRMYEYYDAVLHGVREGLVLLDNNGRVALVNDEARRLLVLGDVRGHPLAELDLPEPLVTSIVSGSTVPDEIQLVADRVLLVNRAPALWQGVQVGVVVTLRDHTELQQVSGELDTVRALAQTLRAQTHESSNRLHTVVSLIELGKTEEAVQFATDKLETAQALADRVDGLGAEPVIAAVLLGKSAEAAERGIDLVIDPRSAVEGTPLDQQELVSVVGNLIDNAMDAVMDRPVTERVITVTVEADTDLFLLDVADNGPGLDTEAALHAFEQGWSTKRGEPGIGRGIGLALVAQIVRRHDGTVEVVESDLGGACFQVRIGEV